MKKTEELSGSKPEDFGLFISQKGKGEKIACGC